MKKMTVRDFEEKDSQKYADRLLAIANINLVDPSVYEYPTCRTLVVEKDGEQKLMNSFHLVIVQEALAPQPDISPKEHALALRALNDYLKKLARMSGVREIMFGCADPRVEKFAVKHGFEKLPFPMFRMKVCPEKE
jgi:hypothetical protein